MPFLSLLGSGKNALRPVNAKCEAAVGRGSDAASPGGRNSEAKIAVTSRESRPNLGGGGESQFSRGFCDGFFLGRKGCSPAGPPHRIFPYPKLRSFGAVSHTHTPRVFQAGRVLETYRQPFAGGSLDKTEVEGCLDVPKEAFARFVSQALFAPQTAALNRVASGAAAGPFAEQHLGFTRNRLNWPC